MARNIIHVPGKEFLPGPSRLLDASFRELCIIIPGIVMKPPNGICYWDSNRIPISLLQSGISQDPKHIILATFMLRSKERWKYPKLPCPLCGGGCFQCNKYIATDGEKWWDAMVGYAIFDMTNHKIDLTIGDLGLMKDVWPKDELWKTSPVS